MIPLYKGFNALKHKYSQYDSLTPLVSSSNLGHVSESYN